MSLSVIPPEVLDHHPIDGLNLDSGRSLRRELPADRSTLLVFLRHFG